MVKRPQSPKEIATALKQGGVLSQSTHFYANVTTTLKRLTASGDVVRTNEGWGLAEWYPNKPRGSEEPKKKRKRRKKATGKAGTKKASMAISGPRLLNPGKGDGQTMTWKPFLAEARRAGKSMKQAAAEWNTLQEGK